MHDRAAPGRIAIIACLAALANMACAPQHETVREALEAFEPAQRVRAVKMAVGRGDQRIVPALVDRLDDEDAAVRLAAIAALQQLTGKRFEYDPWLDERGRRHSVNAWRDYVATRASENAGWAAPESTNEQGLTR